MKNIGVDLEIWKILRKKWADLHSSGHEVSVEFQLVSHPSDKNNILAIDVIQTVDDEIIVETVQRNAGESYTTLAIDGLSKEQLEQTYKDIARPLYLQADQRDVTLKIAMAPTSPISGELRGVLEKHGPDAKSNIQVNYQHYYILNAIREKMGKQMGKSLSKITAAYRGDDLEFSFDY
jgi:hypothetical protein